MSNHRSGWYDKVSFCFLEGNSLLPFDLSSKLEMIFGLLISSEVRHDLTVISDLNKI